jgi:hypothetical protein
MDGLLTCADGAVGAARRLITNRRTATLCRLGRRIMRHNRHTTKLPAENCSENNGEESMFHHYKGRYRRTFAALAIPAAAAAISLGAVSAASAGASTTTTGFTATQSVTNRDDSGANGGNWALDAFTATTVLHGNGIVANTNCPGIVIGACHKITGTITDHGTFTTQIGNAVPGTGSLNSGSVPNIGAAVTGPLTGTLSYSFYTDHALSTARVSNAPSSVSGGSPSTGQWPEQFFPAGTNFWDGSGNTGGAEYLGSGPFNFTYTAALGSDSQCPNVSGRWVDSSTGNDGANAVDGNILAPSSSSC